MCVRRWTEVFGGGGECVVPGAYTEWCVLVCCAATDRQHSRDALKSHHIASGLLTFTPGRPRPPAQARLRFCCKLGGGQAMIGTELGQVDRYPTNSTRDLHAIDIYVVNVSCPHEISRISRVLLFVYVCPTYHWKPFRNAIQTQLILYVQHFDDHKLA